MKFLRLIATMDPRHGGPSAGLRAITPSLEALGHATTFVTLDAPGRAAGSTAGAEVIELGPARGAYAFAPRLEPWLRANAHHYDAVFIHGLWQHHGRVAWRTLRRTRTPYFVFPHGMLDPWFRHTYPLKHAKKWVYWQLCERHVLRHAAAVLFTCEEERRLARESFSPYSCRERVVAYGTAAPSGNPDHEIAAWRASLPTLGKRPFWLFLGRLHPKKGADVLLRAYAELGRSATRELPALVLAGPFSDPAYRAQLESLAAALPPRCRAFFPGMLEGDRKWGALRSAEVFVLPSHQENFGIAVVESLAVGTPVLISRKVNIWDAIESERAGLTDIDDDAGTLRLLRRWEELSPAHRSHMQAAATALFRQRYEISRVARSLIEVVSPFVRGSRDPSHDPRALARSLR
jgi:Glycosyltransferase